MNSRPPLDSLAPIVGGILLTALAAITGPLQAAEAPRPIRVLFTAADGGSPEAARAYHEIIEALGRDAIFVDWLEEKQATPEAVGLYDVVLKASEAPDAAAVRAAVETKTKTEVKEAWKKFLADPRAREATSKPGHRQLRKTPGTDHLSGTPERGRLHGAHPGARRLGAQLFAAEPDIRKPIAFAWDDRGRLWVAETSDYPHGVAPDGIGSDAIRICEDTDGDGRADKFTVFADKLNIPTGLVLARGGVIVSQPPRFLFLKDTNGDDKADTREDILTGWGIGDTHAQAAQLHYGVRQPDLRHRRLQRLPRQGQGRPGGALRSGHVPLQIRRHGPGIPPPVHQQHVGIRLQRGRRPLRRHRQQRAQLLLRPARHHRPRQACKVMTAKKINVEDKAHAITPNYRQVDVMGGYTAAAGHMFIESASLPARLQGKAMVCEPTMKLIALMDVKPDGRGVRRQ